ncbi:MAG: HD domain-containing protein [Clostridiaceae bacterium]|nr:HD domain-containing protein [Clostridiaceae bacterium]
MTSVIPQPVITALRQLRAEGFSAYLVGGCIRSLLLHMPPKDYDLTTNAEPDQVLRIFRANHTIETGLQHGTVMVVIDNWPLEITTYRIDGPYTDKRRPDQVQFTRNLIEDLSRRDFTINAMAWSPFKADSQDDLPASPEERAFDPADVIDPFQGRQDLAARLIRCVGAPEQRFAEDALRILRALRFAAVLDFQLEEQTGRAIHQTGKTLRIIARERIQSEFGSLICGLRAPEILRDYLDVFGVFIPELLPLKDFNQYNPHHHLDLLSHSLLVLRGVPPQTALRLAALLHDIGKPATSSRDSQGIGHFYGHQQKGADMARAILLRLRWDQATLVRVVHLIQYHDSLPDATPKSVKHWLHKHSPGLAHDLLILKKADILAQNPVTHQGKLNHLQEITRLADQILADEQCFTLRQLAVNGKDLLRIGCPKGRSVGNALQYLLDEVIDGHLPNEHQALLEAAVRYCSVEPDNL